MPTLPTNRLSARITALAVVVLVAIAGVAYVVVSHAVSGRVAPTHSPLPAPTFPSTPVHTVACRHKGARWCGSFSLGQPISTSEFPLQSYVGDHIKVVPDPDGSDVAVARYSVANSDQPYPGSHPRADMLTRNWFTNGSVMFASIPVKIPTGLPPFYNTGSSFFQWAEAKDTNALRPSWGLGLVAGPDGRDHYFLEVSPTATDPYPTPWVGPAVDGKWHTAIVAMYYTNRLFGGWVQMWWDGKPVTFDNGKTRFGGITTITDGASSWPLDINNYRSFSTDPGTVTIYHGPPEIGRTLASVQPAIGRRGP